jgi:hypothetical protein
MTTVAAPPRIRPELSDSTSATPVVSVDLTFRLDRLRSDGVMALHRRRVADDAVVDHLAVSTSGVYVIAAVCFAGASRLLIDGAFFGPDGSLVVNGRDCTSLARTAHRAVAAVSERLAVDRNWAEIPVHGLLCFIDSAWSADAALTVDGLDLLGVDRVADRVRTAGRVTPYTVSAVTSFLASASRPE